MTKRIVPADVFNGATVRRAYADEVLDIVERTSTAHREFLVGNMLSSAFADEWTLPQGRALRTPSFFGRRGSFWVEDEAARAAILRALGADLSRSRTYRAFR